MLEVNSAMEKNESREKDGIIPVPWEKDAILFIFSEII